MRAEVPNPDGSILPGQYIRATMTIGEYVDAVVVPEQAVLEGQEGPRVFVVDAANKVQVAKVNPVDDYQGLRVLESGLEAGQKVIVEGIQLVRPGQEVKPVEVPLEQFQTDRPRRLQRRSALQQQGLSLPGHRVPRPERREPADKQAQPEPKKAEPESKKTTRSKAEPDQRSHAPRREEGEVRRRHGQFLHRAADLRDRAGLAHALDRRHLHLHPADRAVSRDHAAAGSGHDDLHRRRRQTVAETVTTPIEQQINGVKGMIYFSSDSTSNGVSTIVATFDVGYSQDIGAVDIQNRVQTAQAVLPPEVKQFGVTIKKTSTDMVCVVNLVSPDGRYDSTYLDNYAQIYVLDVLKRIAGRERRQRVRAQVRDADLARPGPAGRPAHRAGGSDRGDPVREPPGGRGQDRQPAGAAGAGLQGIPDPDQGAA